MRNYTRQAGVSKSMVPTAVRHLLGFACLLLYGCGPRLTFNTSQMTYDEMLKRSSLVFVGVIEKHHIEPRPFTLIDPPEMYSPTPQSWKIMRREIRIESVLRGAESRKVVDVYEFFGQGPTVGDWNSTWDGERALFLVQLENGRYHVVRDWWRSIFPITSGPKRGLPLDDSHPFWERVALMSFWIEPRSDTRITYPEFRYNNLGGALSQWRTIKLERGLVRHPSQAVRVAACRELMSISGWSQDECWDSLTDSDRALVPGGRNKGFAVGRPSLQEHGAEFWWTHYPDRDIRRIQTAVSDRRLRAEFCKLYARDYPGDHDNGCPADQPPPATIVTEHGDVPLLGPWPSGPKSE